MGDKREYGRGRGREMRQRVVVRNDSNRKSLT